jgi:hypothetical protein
MKASSFCNHSQFFFGSCFWVPQGHKEVRQTLTILVNIHFPCKLECGNAAHTNIWSCKVDTVSAVVESEAICVKWPV